MFNLIFDSSSKKRKEDFLVENIYFIKKDENKKASIETNEFVLKNISKQTLAKLNRCETEFREQTSGNLNETNHFVILPKKVNQDYFRNYFAGYVKQKSLASDKLVIRIPELKIFGEYFNSLEYMVQTMIEGLFYGYYSFDKYKSEKSVNKNLYVEFLGLDSQQLKKIVTKTSTLMNAINFTRDLQNEPGNVLFPQSLAESIKQRFTNTKVKVTVFNDAELKKRKMNGLLSVGQGSINKPRMIILHYKPAQKAVKKIALVGKGITFDTGGISIKPADRMWEMKGDMSGAAVVAGIVEVAAKSKLNIEILGVISAAENMPSSTAYKPGDIIKASNGKTIEIDNTDAEGRVALSDALVYASSQSPDVIIDFATLTGACVVALGEFVAGLFSNNDMLSEQLYSSGQRTFDRVWRLPIWDDYNSLNHSDFADVKNCGPRWGGAISAAKFLENFVNPNIPWVHLDIAGPSSPYKFNNYTSPYFTGFGVRLIYDFLESLN
ncbi:MAG: leucyl aminopeptidase [Ignavibacteriaceae bacterium]|nr:leucyl aminopeptidase [Ignavibacteriaceae bacterium]